MRLFTAAMMLTVPAVLPAALDASPSSTIEVGHVFGNEAGQTINGWTQLGGGLYPGRITRNFVTTEVSTCCYAIFERGSSFLILRTEPVARGPKGGVVAARVVAKTTVIKQASEQDIDCNVLWINPVLSFIDTKTKMIRSVIISGDEFVTLKWQDPGLYCDPGD